VNSFVQNILVNGVGMLFLLMKPPRSSDFKDRTFCPSVINAHLSWTDYNFPQAGQYITRLSQSSGLKSLMVFVGTKCVCFLTGSFSLVEGFEKMMLDA
jgi:hypothetical protein